MGQGAPPDQSRALFSIDVADTLPHSTPPGVILSLSNG
jgi:hypothetical protein